MVTQWGWLIPPSSKKQSGHIGQGDGMSYRPFYLSSGGFMAFGSAGQAVRDIDKKVRDATLKALQNASDDVQSTGRDTVARWRHKVDFEETLTMDRLFIEALIKPTGKNVKIFQYVDLGTKGPYLIPKVVVPGKFLRFQVGYSARTMPIAQYNQGSGQHFGAWISKAQVTHPGIKARKFLETYVKELIPTLQVRVQTEITRSVA
jgi:hypothetical protein